MPIRRPMGPKRRDSRPKVCSLCAEHIDYIDYKEVSRLRRFLSESGKILPVAALAPARSTSGR